MQDKNELWAKKGSFSNRLKESQNEKSDKNNLDFFVVFVFKSPSEKEKWANKFLGDAYCVYTEGEYYSVKEHENPII
jgi:hypothetical protein